MIVTVIVIVIVIVPVMVAALENGNEAVAVIEAVDVSNLALPQHRYDAFIPAREASPIRRFAGSFTASITATISFPFRSAPTITGATTSTARGNGWSPRLWPVTHPPLLVIGRAGRRSRAPTLTSPGVR